MKKDLANEIYAFHSNILSLAEKLESLISSIDSKMERIDERFSKRREHEDVKHSG